MSSLQSLLHLLPLLPPKQRTENLSTCILPTPTPYKQGQWTDTHLGREHRMSPPFFFFFFINMDGGHLPQQRTENLSTCAPPPLINKNSGHSPGQRTQNASTFFLFINMNGGHLPQQRTEILSTCTPPPHKGQWTLTSAENRESPPPPPINGQ